MAGSETTSTPRVEPVPPMERVWIWLRVAYRVPFLFLWSLTSFILCAIAIDHRLRTRVAMLYGRVLLFGLGFRIHLNKKVTERGVIILPTHTSYADIPVIQACFYGHFVATVDIKNWPLFGWGNTVLGTVYVDRGKRGMVAHLLEKGVPMLRRGSNLFIFGEGKASPNPVLPLKRGAFALSEASGAPIVPVVTRFAEAENVAWAFHGPNARFREHIVRFLGTVKNRRIDVTVLPAVTADMFPDQDTFRAAVRAAMQRVHDDPSLHEQDLEALDLYGLDAADGLAGSARLRPARSALG